MLKTTLYKACFILSSFIFMAVNSGSRTIGPKPVEATHITHRAGTHEFDSTGLCTCIPFSAKDELVNAPRIQLNKNAAPFVKKYNKENGFFLDKIRAKSSPYFTVIDSVFTNAGLPVELKYLAVIESKLNNNARSGVGAVGLWQLMPVAAKQFGLKMGKYDERKNTYRSSVAAAKCLTYLHNMFGDWLLTLAAYNCGPGGVLKAIKKSGSHNYWALQSFLPEETRKHVKRFIAIHYYFEGHGSLTTLTKTETEAHIKAVASFTEKMDSTETDSLSVVKQ